jgi:1,3-beta-glucan synthase
MHTSLQVLLQTFAFASSVLGSEFLQRELRGTDTAAQNTSVVTSNSTSLLLRSGGLLTLEFQRCGVPLEATVDEISLMISFNCKRVESASHAFDAMLDWSSAEIASSWEERRAAALELCNRSLSGNVSEEAAELALAAWGSVLMQGRECCNIARPPYCVTAAQSNVSVLTIFILSVSACVLVLIAPFVCKNSVERPSLIFTSKLKAPSGGAAVPPSIDVLLPPDAQFNARCRELEAMWMGSEEEGVPSTSMSAPPHAGEWARLTARLFTSLQFSFDFQPGSVQNQFEHLISLWRSHLCIVKDRNGPGGSEEELLRLALHELHADVLAGFQSWRVQCGSPPLGSACTRALGDFASSTAVGLDNQVQLVEVCTFLLVWGEAGNVRFMPEALYFITELALTASAKEACRAYTSPAPAHSCQFLAQIIRPIYNAVFDENYEEVGVDTKTGKDVKVLREGCGKFLPADCCNYDDWNELFCNVEALLQAIVLTDDSDRLSKASWRDRFALLPHVNWQLSLKAAKTHREVHSMWGVYAATHRVWFLHGLMFSLSLFWISARETTSDRVGNQMSLCGGTPLIRLATTCLIVPLHALCWKCSRWFVAGHRLRRISLWDRIWTVACGLFWTLPLISYIAVRYFEYHGMMNLELESKESSPLLRSMLMCALLALHFLISAIGAAVILFWPAQKEDLQWQLTRTPWSTRIVRWAFWIAVLTVKGIFAFQSIRALRQADTDLRIAQVGHESVAGLKEYMFSPAWISDAVQRLLLWGAGFILFAADTQFWVVLGCTVMGVIAGFKQRQWNVWRWALEDAISRIPERFSEKVLGSSKHLKHFPAIWNRMVQHMQYEDKVDAADGNLLYTANRIASLDWSSLQGPLVVTPGEAKAPELFTPACACERVVRRDLGLAKDRSWPRNDDARWRVTALARGLTMNIPRPFKAPFFPGLTVLIPHYADSIHMTEGELLGKVDDAELAPLMAWLEQRYAKEFKAFSARMASKVDGWPKAGCDWDEYTSATHWEKICTWASMRSQTLWRTVAGMMLYHEVLDYHRQLERDRDTCFEAHDWDASEVFRCVISMQMYPFLSEQQLRHTNKMLDKFQDSLKIAFIDFDAKGDEAANDGVHARQQRRYFSCLMDKTCASHPTKAHQRMPKLRIELPGFPILGDGKGDNQNHSIVFTRGPLIQVIDANQGAYFEQMMLLPCVLGEFRNSTSGFSKSIVGFPEHITSDIGSIGDFAAGAETAFGTLLQRSYAVLGARMHYGHPDMMNKTFMMQQGGISKATKTVNLSEDIFAGMDFTLRGAGRDIRHAEYFHVSKGRDLGFNTVLTFFAKLSAGTGEQLLTRQMLRLGHVMGLGEFLMFFYAHAGFYLTQFLVSRSVPLLCFLWLLFLLDEETPVDAVGSEVAKPRADVMASLLSSMFSWLIGLYMLAQTAPLFTEVAMQNGLFAACRRILRQMATLAPLHFIFQAKVIGTYVTNEIRYGGASYMPTGRGLPTERRPFIGRLKRQGGGSGGLYNDWAQVAFYDGARLLAVFFLIVMAGGLDVKSQFQSSLSWWCFCVLLTVVAWLFAPAIFNPYQFAHRYFRKDWTDWFDFFFSGSSTHWIEWYENTQLKPSSGVRASMLDTLMWVLFISCWNMVLKHKMHVLTVVFPGFKMVSTQVLALLPPVASSFCLCVLMSLPVVKRRCPRLGGLSLAVLAPIVMVFDLVEGIASLRQLILLGWWKAFVGGLVMKYALLSFLLLCSEIGFRFKGEAHGSVANALDASLKLWLHCHRMAMDMLCSLLILCSLTPFVLLDYIREMMHIHCSIHHLIVYRGQGLRMRESVTVPTGSFTAHPGEHVALPEDAPSAGVDVEADAAVEDAPKSEDPVAVPAWSRFFSFGHIWGGGEHASGSSATSVEQQLEEGTRGEDTRVAPPLPSPAQRAAAEAGALQVVPSSRSALTAVSTESSLPPVDTVPSLPQPARDQEVAQPGKQGRPDRPSSRPIYWRRIRKPVSTVQHRATKSMTTVSDANVNDELEAQQVAEPISEQ